MRRRRNPSLPTLPDGLALFGAMALTAWGVTSLILEYRAKKAREQAFATAEPIPYFAESIPGYGNV